MCAHFCYQMVHCGIFVWCIVGFVRWISWRLIVWDCGYYFNVVCSLTHWGRVTHICVSRQIIIGSDNGLSPGRRQAIIWTNAGILLINFNRNSYIFTQENPFENVVWKMAAILSRPQCVKAFRPDDNGRHFTDYIFKCIMILWFMQISLKPFLKGPIETISQLI